MNKQIKSNKKRNIVKNSNKNKSVNKSENKNNIFLLKKFNLKITPLIILLSGILLIFSSYAWFSVNLNVKVKTFNMLVSKNGGLTISLDAINYDTFVEISADKLIKELKLTYPNNTSQWAGNGLVPVSTNGILDSNSNYYHICTTSGVRYRNRTKENGFVTTTPANESISREFNNFIAFDLFLKNVSGSPIPDNLYLETGTEFGIDDDAKEEMRGLFNSVRLGFLKIGSMPTNTNPTVIQNLKCNNNCESVIYEPNSSNHTNLSIERALQYDVNLVDGEYFPTYGCIKTGGPIYVKNAVSGSPNLDPNYFALQKTVKEGDFTDPLFEIPDGVTKVRVYLWIEGQDIDSLETDSSGSDISVSINLIKDTKGYSDIE